MAEYKTVQIMLYDLEESEVAGYVHIWEDGREEKTGDRLLGFREPGTTGLSVTAETWRKYKQMGIMLTPVFMDNEGDIYDMGHVCYIITEHAHDTLVSH